jgi:hypothetical protein
MVGRKTAEATKDEDVFESPAPKALGPDSTMAFA